MILISLTRLNGKIFILNSELIEFIEETPDTVISLTSGKKIVVSESVDDTIDKIVKYRRRVFSAVNADK
ncbi:MAG: flagellar FlbD family protein [Acidaminobacteraceae bacterium]